VTDAITFQHANVLAPFEATVVGPFDFLVSNPPYVSIQDWKDLEPEVRQFEPRQAVSDQNDGYEFYRRIGEIAPSLVRANGWVIVEAGFGQSEVVSDIFHQAGLTEISVVNDLQDIPRVVLGRHS
jgi:release factor glutamine methyltransferase